MSWMPYVSIGLWCPLVTLVFSPFCQSLCTEVYRWRSWHQQIIALLADLQPNAASLWNHLGSHCRWSTAESIMGVVTLGANRCCTRSVATTWKLIPLPLILKSRKKRGVCRWTCRGLTFVAFLPRETHFFGAAAFHRYQKKEIWTNS